MDWWVIEYDNKNFDSHVFLEKLQKEFTVLLVAGGGGPFGTNVVQSKGSGDMCRVYFNAKGASIPGVGALLSKYGAKPCAKPTEEIVGFASNHPDPM